MCYMDWLVITYRLPPEPSRHRVAVWRELRRVGAVALQQATWAVPDRPYFVEGVTKAIALVERADGEPIVLRARADSEEMTARLETLFTDAREEEWTEFPIEFFIRCAGKEIDHAREINGDSRPIARAAQQCGIHHLPTSI